MLHRHLATALTLSFAIGVSPLAVAQNLPANVPTKEQLANDNNLFLSLARKALKWEEPEEPVRIVGPLYFVGTKGLGAFLFTTSEGHILMNTGMPSSGPMIVESIRKLGFKPEDIKLMINGHAHIDHAGAFAYFKQQFGAQLAVMKDDVAAMESGDRDDFKYANDFVYPGSQRSIASCATATPSRWAMCCSPPITRPATPGERPPGSRTSSLTASLTSWFFPTGPVSIRATGWRKIHHTPASPDDYRRTHHMLEMLKPDIWLAQHNEYYDLEGKRQRAKTEGVNAWIDPEGYRRFVAGKKRAFRG